MQTDWKALERKTKVYRHGTPVSICPYTWRRFNVSVDGQALRLKRLKDSGTENCITLDELPREFFNHQLLECKTRNDDGSFDTHSLAAFVEAWGLPLSPYRFCNRSYVAPDDELAAAMELTDSMNADGPMRALSIAEAALTIECLQHAVYLIHEAIRANDSDEGLGPLDDVSLDLIIALYPIDLAARLPVVIFPHVGAEHMEQRGVTAAICTQIVETIADKDTPWRECAAPDCNKRFGVPVIFKYQQNDKEDAQRNPNAEYCSVKCRERRKKQRQRAARREANGKAKGERG